MTNLPGTTAAGASATAGGAGSGLRQAMRLRPETYELVFGTVYTGLAANLLLVVSCLPALFLVLATDLTATWPALVVAAPLCGPALAAVFALFGEFSAEGSVRPVRAFARAWRRHLRRGLLLGALGTAVTAVLTVDIAYFWGRTAGAVAIPVLAVLLAGTVVTAVLALAALPQRADASLRQILAAALFLGARRWYAGAAIVVVLVLLVSLTAARPAIALGFAASPLLYAVWGAARFALRPPS
ncbi:ferredoxin-NADPH reductase [Myceligenerans crystallogenes]|uniref:Ferredoxin-NADPH reductase n=1 Tax=Myceligenerans crystallogenes TaxID=316335 RepID=A0ABN2N890_9MICO